MYIVFLLEALVYKVITNYQILLQRMFFLKMS